MSEHRPFFEVDRAGLAALQARRGKEFVVLELLQNALDEDVTEVELALEPITGRPLVRVRVCDDSPSGFQELAHAYTLFADTVKRADALKRGRFNLGEKLVLACCETARIETTTGTVSFDRNGRRVQPRRRRDRGSVFEGALRMNRTELADALQRVEMVLVPAGVQLWLNGRLLSSRPPLLEFEAPLPTEVLAADGAMRRTERRTQVRLLEPREGERPHLYELGLPVVEIPGRWHLDVGQKIPQGMERDTVSPAYVRRLMTAAVAAAHDLLEPEDTRAEWVGEALASGKLPDAAIERIVTGRFGERRVSVDPSDPEGTKLAASRGYEVVPSGAFSRDQWRAIRASGAIQPAGQVTPSPRPYTDDPDAPVRLGLAADRVTPGMRAVAALVERLARRLLDQHVIVDVLFVDDNAVPAKATFGPVGGGRCRFEFNVAHLGTQFFEAPSARPEILQLVVHELGHWFSGDHLASAYHTALCRLAGALARLALDEPAVFSDSASHVDA